MKHRGKIEKLQPLQAKGVKNLKFVVVFLRNSYQAFAVTLREKMEETAEELAKKIQLVILIFT